MQRLVANNKEYSSSYEMMSPSSRYICIQNSLSLDFRDRFPPRTSFPPKWLQLLPDWLLWLFFQRENVSNATGVFISRCFGWICLFYTAQSLSFNRKYHSMTHLPACDGRAIATGPHIYLSWKPWLIRSRCKYRNQQSILYKRWHSIDWFSIIHATWSWISANHHCGIIHYNPLIKGGFYASDYHNLISIPSLCPQLFHS